MDQDAADLVVRYEDGDGLTHTGAGAHLPRTPLAVVFDLDGTLLDTERAYRAAFMETLTAFGLALPPGAYDRLVGLPSTTRRHLMPGLLGAACPVDRFFDHYYAVRTRHLADGIALKPGAAQLLAYLHALLIPAAIATSASAATAASHLATAGLTGRFHPVITRDDVTCGKPAPDCFMLAARQLGVPARDCLALEDSPHGVAAAHAAGMMVVMVPDAVPPTPATRRHCVAVLGSLAETVRLHDRSRFRV